MATGTIETTTIVAGIRRKTTTTKTYDSGTHFGDGSGNIPLAAGKVVTEWVKTDADTAACTLPGGHGYSTGKFDVYWTGGVRYDVDGTVSTNALGLDSGTGDDFPESAEVGVIVCPPQQVDTSIDGDAVVLLHIDCTQRSHVLFMDADTDTIFASEVLADECIEWHDTSPHANPMTGDPITVCWASNGSTTAAILTILVGVDSTP
jgi:hypothetical protein